MRTSRLRKNEGDGYESWVSNKKKKKEVVMAKEIVQEVDSIELGVERSSVPCRRGH